MAAYRRGLVLKARALTEAVARGWTIMPHDSVAADVVRRVRDAAKNTSVGRPTVCESSA
jgi:hypothetical protein